MRGRFWIGLLVAISLIVISLPTLVSTTFGKNTLIDFLSEKSGFNIEADRLSLGWFGPQKIEKIHGKSAAKGVNFDIDEVVIDRGLLGFISHLSLGKVSVVKPVLYIQPKISTLTAGVTSSEEETKSQKPLELPLDQFNIEEGSVRVVNPDGSITRIDQVNVQIERGENVTHVGINGVSVFDEKGIFRIQTTIPDSAFDESDTYLASHLFPSSLTAEVVDFPTKVIDETIRVFDENFPLSFQSVMGPTFNFELDHQANHYVMNVKSEHLNGNGILELKEGSFVASKPLTLKWNAIPAAINPLLRDKHLNLSLTKTTLITLSLTELLGNPIEFKSSYRLDAEETEFTMGEGTNLLKLKSFGIISHIDRENDTREIAGKSELLFNDSPFNVLLESATQLDLTTPMCLEDCLKGQWNLSIDKLPLKLVELVADSNTPFEKILGKDISLYLYLSEKTNENLIGLLLRSNHLSSEWFEFSLGDFLILKKPVVLQLKPLKPIPLTSEISALGDFSLHFKTFQFPQEGDFEKLWKNLTLSIELDSQKVVFHRNETLLPLEADQVNLRIQKNRRSTLNVLANGELNFSDALKPFFGETLTLSSTAELDVYGEDQWTIDPFTLNASSTHLNGKAKLFMDERFKIRLKEPINIEYLADSSLLKPFPMLHFDKLLKPALLKFEISSFETVIDLNQLNQSKIEGSFTASDILVQEKEGMVAALESFESNFYVDLQGDEIQLKAKAKTGTSQEAQKGYLDLNLDLTRLFNNGHFSIKESCYKGKIAFDRFPSVFITPFLYNVPNAYELLGDQFSGSLEGEFLCNEDPAGFMNLKFKNESFDIKTRLKIDHDFIKIYSNPENLNLIFIDLPKDKATILIPTNLQLESGIHAKIKLDYLSVPNFLTSKYSLIEIINLIEGIGTLHAESIYLDQLTLPPIDGSFEFPFGQKAMSFNLKGDPSNIFNLQLLLERPVIQFNHWSDLNGSLTFKGTRIPLTLLAKNFNVDPILLEQMEELFENNTDISLDIRLNEKRGNLELSLKGPNCELHVPGKIEGQILHLQDTATLTMNVTPKVGKSVIGEIVPILSTVISGSGPINLKVYPEGFSLPLKMHEWNQIQVNKGEIDVGILSLYVDKEVEDILNFLKFNAGNTVEVWGTPIYFSVKSEAVTLERFDFLVARKFPLALWGKIDFLNDRVNLKLGLGAKTLENVFDIKNLPADFMLPVNLRGPIKDISLDKAKATAKIAALVAEEKGSPEGLLIGNLLQLLSGSFKEESAPPPTTDPLPWTTSDDTKEKGQPTEVKKILKGLEEGAKSLFKKIR